MSYYLQSVYNCAWHTGSALRGIIIIVVDDDNVISLHRSLFSLNCWEFCCCLVSVSWAGVYLPTCLKEVTDSRGEQWRSPGGVPRAL